MTEISSRNCYIDVAEDIQVSCNEENQLNCVKCGKNNCNTVKTRPGNMCIRCSGAECNSLDINAISVACESDCYVGKDSNGFIERGCSTEFTSTSNCATSDDQQRNCLVCKGDFCNFIVYPLVNRLKCITCEGDTCKNNPAILNSEHCLRLHTEEKCVTVFDAESNVVERGCSSTLQRESEFCSSTNEENCLRCIGNDCNVQTAKNQIGICVSCDSQTDPACIAFPTTRIGCTFDQCYEKLVGK